MPDTEFLNHKTVAFLGNQDNVAVILRESLREGGINSDIYTLSSELKNARSTLNHTSVGKDSDDIAIIDDTDKTLVQLPRELKDKLQTYDFLIVSGLNTPYIASQLNNKNMIYMPVGAAEIHKFTLPEKSTASKFSYAVKRWRINNGSLFRTIHFTFKAKSLLDKFSSKIAGVTSRHISGQKMQEYSAFSDRAFPNAKALAWPEFLPQVKFIKSQLSGAEVENIHMTYSQYDRVIIAPSRKWITPDLVTGYTKSTEFILKALDFLFDEVGVDQQKNKVIWLDHGPDAEYCKDYLAKSSWREAVDILPHQTAKSLWAMFSLQNAIMLDEFNDNHWGNLGGASREALSLGCPVFGRNFKPNEMPYAQVYDNVPFTYCFNQREMNETLKKYVCDDDYYKEKRAEIAAWNERFDIDARLVHAMIDLLALKEPPSEELNS